jgi:small subunit ribosomal protein S17
MSEQNKARSLKGQVVSDKMDKSITVLVERRVEHPIYRKYVRKSSKVLAHDEGNECRQGDVVIIEECRPLSKKKAWRLQEIIERAPQV